MDFVDARKEEVKVAHSASVKLNDGCAMCPELVKSRKRITWGTGSPNSLIVWVGEAPGRHGCDVTGIPFFGDRSGDLFQEMLGYAGWNKDSVWVTNVVKCCPPGNRAPEQGEIDKCSKHYLSKELKAIKPFVNRDVRILVIAVGSTASRLLIGQGVLKSFMTRHFIRRFNKDMCVIPIYHPAYVLRDPKRMDEYKRAFIKIRQYHDHLLKRYNSEGILKYMIKKETEKIEEGNWEDGREEGYDQNEDIKRSRYA